MRYLLILFLVLCQGTALAQIYSTVDEHGRRVFTDRPPHAGAPVVPLKTINQLPAPELTFLPTESPVHSLEITTAYQLSIASPAPEQTLQDGSGSLTIEVQLSPELDPNHRLQALLNGQAQGPSSTAPVFSVPHVDRGTHSLAVQVLDHQGRVLAVSAAQTVHIRRISLSDRRRVNPCQSSDYGKRLECPLKDKPKDKPKDKKDLPFIPFL